MAVRAADHALPCTCQSSEPRQALCPQEDGDMELSLLARLQPPRQTQSAGASRRRALTNCGWKDEQGNRTVKLTTPKRVSGDGCMRCKSKQFCIPAGTSAPAKDSAPEQFVAWWRLPTPSAVGGGGP
eukprot:437048-Prymnesium_polylepis.1